MLNEDEMRCRFSDTFARLDMDDFSYDDLFEWLYIIDNLTPVDVAAIENNVINKGMNLYSSFDMYTTGKLILKDAHEVLNPSLVEDSIYVLCSYTEEVLFCIDTHWSEEGYEVHNTMGSGSWKCNTIEECINIIEAAYNDEVVNKSFRI